MREYKHGRYYLSSAYHSAILFNPHKNYRRSVFPLDKHIEVERY